MQHHLRHVRDRGERRNRRPGHAGGRTGVGDHVKIGADATAMAGSAVATDVQPGTIVGGYPAVRRDVAFERFMNVARLKRFFPKIDGPEKAGRRTGKRAKDRLAGHGGQMKGGGLKEWPM